MCLLCTPYFFEIAAFKSLSSVAFSMGVSKVSFPSDNTKTRSETAKISGSSEDTIKIPSPDAAN